MVFKTMEWQSSGVLSCTSGGILNSAAGGLQTGKEHLLYAFRDIIASYSIDSSEFTDTGSAYTGSSSYDSRSSEEDSLFENCDKNAGTPATKEDYPLELFTCF
jgi:hypothetical protein